MSMNTAALRRKLAAAIRAAEDAMAKAEREKRPMSRDTEHGRVLALRDVVAWMEAEEAKE